eukprot:1423831-Amphidinium_carterae.1
MDSVKGRTWPAWNSTNFTRFCDLRLSVPTALEASASSMTVLLVSVELTVDNIAPSDHHEGSKHNHSA